MDIGVYPLNKMTEEQILELFKKRESFVLEDIGRTNLGEAAETLEKILRSLDLDCRIYTKGRSAAIAATIIPTPVTVVSGLASAIAIGVHNVATWNPDYEIAKNPAMGTLTVEYKK